MLATPVFDSALLGDLIQAAERRGKAIRYHGTLGCSREVEGGAERLNIDVTTINVVRLHLSVWPDGAFSLSVTKPGPSRTGGWAIYERVEGTVTGCSPSEVIARLEATMEAPTDAAHIWHPKHLTNR